MSKFAVMYPNAIEHGLHYSDILKETLAHKKIRQVGAYSAQ